MPSTRASPAVMESIPISILIVVLLPAPLGPSSPNVLPRGIVQRQIVHRQRAAESLGQTDKLDGRTVLGWSAHERLLPSGIAMRDVSLLRLSKGASCCKAACEDFPNLRRAHAGT